MRNVRARGHLISTPAVQQIRKLEERDEDRFITWRPAVVRRMPGQRAGAKRRRSQERPADPRRRARLWDGLQRPALQSADAHRQEQYRSAGAEVGLLDQ